jgi:hypothetical protein
MASSRSARSRSRDRASTGGGVANLAHVVPFDHAAYLRVWLRHLQAPPSVLAGRAYFQLVNEHRLPGHVWLQAEPPHVINFDNVVYTVDFTLWHGGDLGSATRVPLLRGSANQHRALVMNWPRAPRGRGRVIVSRLVGMSLFFDADRWRYLGYERFCQALHVHHMDDVHEHCLLSNLSVEIGSEHVARHNARR